MNNIQIVILEFSPLPLSYLDVIFVMATNPANLVIEIIHHSIFCQTRKEKNFWK
jgi:hypothetical protein